MEPLERGSIVRHLQVLIVLLVLLGVVGGWFAYATLSHVAEADKAATLATKTVSESHVLIKTFLEETKTSLARGAENSDIIRENSVELTQGMRTVLQKIEQLERRLDTAEQEVGNMRTDIAAVLHVVSNPFQSVVERFRKEKK